MKTAKQHRIPEQSKSKLFVQPKFSFLRKNESQENTQQKYAVYTVMSLKNVFPLNMVH